VSEPPRRFAGFRGKITPRSLERFGNADPGGTLESAQGSADGASTVDERDQSSTHAGGHELASEVGDRVRSVISAAEAAANAVRHEAEQAAAIRRRVAEDEARRIIEDAKADADAYLAERSRRISELSDTVVERAETIVARLDRAEEVRRQLQALADSLGESAERLAGEVRIGSPPPTVRAPSTPPAAPPRREPLPPESGVAPESSAAPAPPREQEPAPSAAETAAERVAPPRAEPLLPPTEPAPPPRQEPVAPPPEPETAPPGLATPPEAAPDVVRLDRREPPAPQPSPPQRRDADQQLGARLVALQMAVAGGNRGEVEAHLKRTFDLEEPSAILDDVFGQGTDAGKRVAWPRTEDGAA
jgi:hypothetical protein